jgi:hypothetical protein
VRFLYLVQADSSVAAIPPDMIDFEHGTSVVHFHMDIPQYSARLTQLTGSLWWLLQNTMFDPVLPFWAEERPSTFGVAMRSRSSPARMSSTSR